MKYQPRLTNLVTMLVESVGKYGPRQAFGTRRSSGWEWISYAELGRKVDEFRGGLANLGIGKGDRVAVISNNRVEWAVGAHATYGLAAVYVPMYETQLDKEWAYILADSGAKICLVSSRKILERVRKLQADCPALETIVCFEGGTGSDGLSFDAIVQRGREHPKERVVPADTDIAMFIYTSGTTGNPKGVRLTHFNLAANVSAILDVSPIRDGELSLAFLPWAHVFGGCIEINSVIATGNSVAICDDTSKLIEYLPEVKPTVLFAVPRIWNRIYDGVQKKMAAEPKAIQLLFGTGMKARSKEKRGESLTVVERVGLVLAQRLIFSKIVERFGGRLRFAFSGAAALSREVAEFIDNLGIQVYEGYGMTESSGATTSNRPGATRIGSVGKPMPGAEIKLDHSAPGAGEGEGEIIIYGTGVMAGYHHLDDVTKQTLTADGGLRTGDLGRIDADGYLYITGRVKELFKLSNGKYVAPALLEETLVLSPYIAQCLVYGDDKPHNVAVVIPDMDSLRAWAAENGVGSSDAEILASPRTRELISREFEKYGKDFKGYERIKNFALSSEPFTTENGLLTPTLKLKRRGAVQRYATQLAALYE